MPKRFYAPKVDKPAAIRRILEKNAGLSKDEALRKLREQRLRPSPAFLDYVHDSMGLSNWGEKEVPVNQLKKARPRRVASKFTLLRSKAAAVRKAIFHNRQASNKAIQEMANKAIQKMVADTEGSVVGPVSLKYISNMRSRMETDFPGEHFSLYRRLARPKH